MKDKSAPKRMSAVDVDQHILDIYEFKRRIGKGAYGIVWKAIERKTKDVVAVKKIFDAFKNKTDAQRTYREITFLQAFSHHPNIIKLKALHKANNNLDIYLVFEYMDTDLHNAIEQSCLLEDVHKRFVMYQLLKATRFIHSANVVHRDQKPSNVLVDRRCRCKIADFGLARSLSRADDSFDAAPSQGDNPLTDYVATRWYRPPEVLLSSKRYSQGVDMWSLGCILAEMLLGKALFPGSSSVDQMERILSALPKPTNHDVEAVCGAGGSESTGAGLLQRAPAPGPSLASLLRGQPPDAVDLVHRLLVLNPERRLSAAQALHHPYVKKFKDHSLGYTISKHIIPELSDDYQWSVDEYRTRLYNGLNKSSPASRRGEAPVCVVAWKSASQSRLVAAEGTKAPGAGRSKATAPGRRHTMTAPVPERRGSGSVPVSVSASAEHMRHHQRTQLAAQRSNAPAHNAKAGTGSLLPRVAAQETAAGSTDRGQTKCARCQKVVSVSASTPSLAPAPAQASVPAAPPPRLQQQESKISQRLQKRQEGFQRVTEWINNKQKFKPQMSAITSSTCHGSNNYSQNTVLRNSQDIYTSTLIELRDAIKR